MLKTLKIHELIEKKCESKSCQFNFKKGESEFLAIKKSPNELIQSKYYVTMISYLTFSHDYTFLVAD